MDELKDEGNGFKKSISTVGRIEYEYLKDSYDFLKNLENRSIDEITALLNDRINYLSGEIDKTNRQNRSKRGGTYDAAPFQKDTLCEDSRILLRKPMESDKGAFIEIKRQNTLFDPMYENPSHTDYLWDEYLIETSLNYSIINKKDHAFLGYCGIKDVRNDVWEIQIELLNQYHRKGYGTEALRMFLNTVSALSGRKEFCSIVDPENKGSQALMEKIGFKPYGISEFMLYSEEIIEKCEEDNLDKIDDDLILLAKKFGTEPRRLLSHVLEYRLTLPK